MKLCGLLIGASKSQQFCFTIQATQERQASRSSRAGCILEVGEIVDGNLGASGPCNPFGNISPGCPVRFVTTN